MVSLVLVDFAMLPFMRVRIRLASATTALRYLVVYTDLHVYPRKQNTRNQYKTTTYFGFS